MFKLTALRRLFRIPFPTISRTNETREADNSFRTLELSLNTRNETRKSRAARYAVRVAPVDQSLCNATVLYNIQSNSLHDRTSIYICGIISIVSSFILCLKSSSVCEHFGTKSVTIGFFSISR